MRKTLINETKNLNYTVREAFKTLRTNFLFCGPEYKSILITSCVKNEGKSTISIELSKSLALSNKKVLLIDADLRKSVFASKYTTTEGEILGLSEYLSGQANYEDVLYSTQNKNLDIIFAGAVPPNPVELLGSALFANLIHESEKSYDYVIVDAAPLGAVIDAAVISAVCNGAIMVITANYIAQRFANDVKEQLERSGCKVLGAILNRIPLRTGSYYNRYYKRYYGKYKKYGYKYGKYSKYGSTGYETSEPSPSFTDEEEDFNQENEIVEQVQESIDNVEVVEASVDNSEKSPKSSKIPMPSKESKYPKPKSKKKKKK